MDPPPHAVYCVSSTSEIMPMSRRKNNPPFPVTISDLQDPTGSTEGYQKAYVAIQEALQALAQKVCQPISYLHARSLEIAEEDDEVSSQYLNVVIGRIPSQFGNVNTPTTNFSILDEVGKPETILYQRCAQIILPGDRVPKGHFLGDAGGRPIALWHPTSRTLHLLWRPLQGDYPVTSLNYHAKLLGYLVRAHGVTLRRWARPIKKQQIKTANRTDVHTWLAKTRSWQERQLENSLAAWNEEAEALRVEISARRIRPAPSPASIDRRARYQNEGNLASGQLAAVSIIDLESTTRLPDDYLRWGAGSWDYTAGHDSSSRTVISSRRLSSDHFSSTILARGIPHLEPDQAEYDTTPSPARGVATA